MRVSNFMMSQVSLDNILEQQSQLLRTQLELSSGKKVLSPSDNPAAARKILDLNDVITTFEQYQRNSDAAGFSLALEESVLTSATDLLQRARELAVQGLNDTLGQNERENISGEIKQILEQMISLGNTQDSDGQYIFGGFNSTNTPFSGDGAGNFTYAGDQGQKLLQISNTRQISAGDSGYDVFMNLPGTTANAFNTLYDLASSLDANAPTQTSLNDIDAIMQNMQTIRSSIGARQGAAESQKTVNEDVILSSREILSNTQDVDIAEAVIELNKRLTGLQAAQQTYTKIQGLSLFNFL